MQKEGIPFLVEQDNESVICIYTPENAKNLINRLEKMRNKVGGELSRIELKVPVGEGKVVKLHALEISIDSESLASLGITPTIYLDTTHSW